MNFCSSLMMLWQELESSARKICLENHTVETGTSHPGRSYFDRYAPRGDLGRVKPGILKSACQVKVVVRGGSCWVISSWRPCC